MSDFYFQGPLDVYLPEKPKLKETAKKILQVDIIEYCVIRY